MSTMVLIADDHPVLRAGLASLLKSEPGIEFVDEAENGLECVEKAVALEPDIIVMDINMPGCSGLEALEEIGRRLPETKVLILTMHDDIGYLKQALSIGGAGYVLKQAAGDELLSAIKTVAGGGVFMHPHHAQALASTVDDAPARDESTASALRARYESLSVREAEVFRLLCLGQSNAEIADDAGLSVKTVETYKARLTRKLGVTSRSGLVRAALELDVLN